MLAHSGEELVNQESGVAGASRKTELMVLKTVSLVARKERVLGLLHEGHCHGCLGSWVLKSDCIFIFLGIVFERENEMRLLYCVVLNVGMDDSN